MTNNADIARATAEFYRRYAESGAIAAEAPQSAISKYFEVAFKVGGKVLDVGSGSGRDVAQLCSKGFDAYGIEPNGAMRRFAAQRDPELAGRLQPGALPVIGAPFGGEFDGLVCSAVMMHLPEEQLLCSWESVRKLLKPTGRVLFSLPSMRPDLLKDDRDQDARFFKNHSPAVIHSMLGSLGFSQIDLGNQAKSKYADIVWSILLYARSANHQSRGAGLER
ncbi:MAG TPA: class I SAM-dependent methyltransferase [Telluria sp.]